MNNFSELLWLFILLGSGFQHGLRNRPKAWFDFSYFLVLLFLFKGNFNLKTNKLVYVNPSNQVQIVINSKEMTNHMAEWII